MSNKFEVDLPKEAKILLWLPSGKVYEGAPNIYLDQKASSLDVCWYYCFNYLRIRYGKDSTNLEKRAIEEIISDYSKMLGAITAQKRREANIIAGLKRIAKKQAITEIDVQQRYQTVLNMINLATHGHHSPDPHVLAFIQTEAKLYKEFIQQTKFENIELFSQNKATEKTVEAHSNLLDAFQSNMHTLIFKQEEDFKNNNNNNQSDSQEEQEYTNELEKLDWLGHEAAIFEICKQYEIEFSNWQPENNFEELVQNLRQFGPHAVNGKIGLPYYMKDKQVQKFNTKEKIGSREIWELDERYYDEDYNYTHMVVIIGAAREAQGEYIYFIDPSEKNAVEGERKVYQMLYNDFINKISSSIDPHNSERKFYLYYGKNYYSPEPKLDNNAEFNNNNLEIKV